MRNYVTMLARSGVATGILGGEATIEAIRAEVRLPKRPRVLDVGSAGGTLSLGLADALSADVVGVDANEEMTSLAKLRAGGVTCDGSVDFRTLDIMSSSAVGALGTFDLVVHRGLEAFMPDRKRFRGRLAEFSKSWGYLVNITPTYEGEAPEALLRRINRATGMHILPRTKDEIVAEYRGSGFRFIAAVPVESAQISEREISRARSSLRQLYRLFNENDQATSAYVIVLRKGGMSVMTGDDMCKR